MKTMPMLYHLAKADFIERIRRLSFLIILAITVFAGYLFVPPVDAGYRVLQVGVQRGIYNSSWIGLMFGLIASLHLSFVGFFLVKNAVHRDRQTRVGQIIASTTISKLAYTVGKWLSNLAVLVVILLVMTLMAVVMQLIRAEDMVVDLRSLIAPIWLMGLPILMITAAIAVLFECVSFMRGGLGNVVFFFIWIGTIGAVMTGAIDEATNLAKVTRDPYGYTRQLVDIQSQVLADDPSAEVGTGLIHTGRDIERTFIWDGIFWTGAIILERVLWVGIAVGAVLLAAVAFDRFDPALRRLKIEGKGILQPIRERLGAIYPRDIPSHENNILATMSEVPSLRVVEPVAIHRKRHLLGVVFAEFPLILKGHNWLWYIGAIGLFVACIFSLSEVVKPYLMLLVWLWPVFVWSQLGVREARHNTSQIVFSTPQPVIRQIPAAWLAGVLFTIKLGFGLWIRLAMMGDFIGIFALFVGALFTPALALALGVWFGTSRAFEAVYLLWWYIGLVNKVPTFDYVGLNPEALEIGMPYVYLAFSIILVLIAMIGRWRRIHF
ncbi:MAG: hypothetical protein GTO18_00835 [Anaerolineales bacterium]|nr:hypothetical protein [Anaerolineales bacterium]